MNLNHQYVVWLTLITLWFINGSSFLAIKVAVDTIPPLLSAGMRFSIAGAIIFTIYFFQMNKKIFKGLYNQTPVPKKPAKEHITLRQWQDSLILGVTLIFGGLGLLTWGAQYLSSGMTGLLNSTIPLWVAIIGYFIYRGIKKGSVGQAMTKTTIVGLAVGFGGLMLLVAPSMESGNLSPIGTLALTASSISWAIGSLYSTRADLPVSVLASSGMVMISGGLILTAVSFAFGENRNLDLMQISLQSTVAQIYLIFIITLVGFTDFYWLLRVTSASLANTFAYVSPVIAVLFGWAILHEKLATTTIIAMIVILLGVALMVTKISQKKTDHNNIQT
jgi:drug/metabolite transporter (DMT)-like permease